MYLNKLKKNTTIKHNNRVKKPSEMRLFSLNKSVIFETD
jgi:hypothetical protein